MYQPVEGKPGLVRDTVSHAILNTDKNAIKRHNKYINDLEKQQKMEKDIIVLKNDINDIKKMLYKLLNCKV